MPPAHRTPDHPSLLLRCCMITFGGHYPMMLLRLGSFGKILMQRERAPLSLKQYAQNGTTLAFIRLEKDQRHPMMALTV